MRILQIIPSLGSGGAERFAVDLCNEMREQGQEVYLCTIQNPNEADYGFYLHELNKEVNFVSLYQAKGFRWQNIFKLKKWIDKINPDIIHLHLSAFLYGYFLSFLICKPYIHTIHSLVDKTIPNKLLLTINKYLYRSGRIKAITISNECLLSYKNSYGLTNAALIFNGRKQVAKTEQFNEIFEEVQLLKKTTDDIYFIHIARYHEAKNQQMLIDVFNRLEKEEKHFQLLVIGDWSFCEEANELKKKAGERIHFLGTLTNVQDYLYCADAFCLSSVYEGLPISLLEALSCGCVPVCTPVGGIKDVVQNEVTGFLSDSVSEDDYYRAVNRFMESKDKIKREDLMKYFQNSFSIEKTASSHIELYKRFL